MHHAGDEFMSRDVLPLPIGVLPEIASDRVERGTAGKRIDITEAEIHAVILILVRRVVVFTEPQAAETLTVPPAAGTSTPVEKAQPSNPLSGRLHAGAAQIPS